MLQRGVSRIWWLDADFNHCALSTSDLRIRISLGRVHSMIVEVTTERRTLQYGMLSCLASAHRVDLGFSRVSNFYKIRPIFKASNFYKIRA